MLRNLIRNQNILRWSIGSRLLSDTSESTITDGEKQIIDVLRSKFPRSSDIQVQDISGGCGAMFEILIESEDFRGLRTVKQHMLVNEALKKEIKDMHGLRINTKVPG